MTTLIFDWSDWDGPATGHVVVTRRTWRRAPESLHVPWQVVLPVDGRATLDVAHVAGEAVSIRWAPRGAASRTDHVLIPDGGEHLAHLLDLVDQSTLEPLPEDLPSAVDLVARAEALTARIESGEFTGAAGVGVESITDEDGDGVAEVRLTSGATSALPLPRGPQGERGERGLTGERGAKGDRGDVGPAPEVSWLGDRLTVGGQTGPSLTGPQGERGPQGLKGDQGDRGPQGLKGDKGDTGATGPANALTLGTVTGGTAAGASLTGEAPEQTLSLVLPQGAKGDRGEQGIQGPPGVVSSASSYILVGPGRPDTPSTTGGVITGSEPVGAEYRSTDGAQVGAFVWMKRPGGKWVVMSGEYTRQVGKGNGATYHEDGSAYQGDLRLGFTPGLVYIALGISSAVDSGKHLILPGIRALMPNFSFNSYSSLPSPLREYFGNITIAGPVGSQSSREDHLWVLPIATWPTAAMGAPA